MWGFLRREESIPSLLLSPKASRIWRVRRALLLLRRLYLSSKKDLNMKYIALSHCWVDTKPAILKKYMLKTMTHGIDWSWLPRTFQDAMIVTRQLGFRYLWIDSLCIIQNYQEDWIKESGAMQNVYANCVLTIAASWGKDSDWSFH